MKDREQKKTEMKANRRKPRPCKEGEKKKKPLKTMTNTLREIRDNILLEWDASLKKDYSRKLKKELLNAIELKF